MKKIIICPTETRDKRLKELSSNNSLNVDFYITINELRNRLFFKLDSKAYLFTRDYLKLKYANAITILSDIYYLNDDDLYYPNYLLLKDLKLKLIEKELLILDPLFKDFVSRFECVVDGYLLNKKEQLIINELKKYTKVTFVEKNIIPKKILCYENSSIDEEVNNVFKQITLLLNQGHDINRIKLTNIDSNYYHLINRYSTLYNIPINLNQSESLLSSSIVKDFLSQYANDKKLKFIVEVLIKKYGYQNDILRKIITIINDNLGEEDLTDVFLYEFNKSKFSAVNFLNAVSVVDLLDYEFSDEDIVFALNFNHKVVPREYKDESFLNDMICRELSIDTSIDKLKLEKMKITNKLYSINNLTVSYKLKTKSKDELPSILIKELGMTVEHNSDQFEYSILNAKLMTAKKLDAFIKYDEFDNSINKFFYLIENDYRNYRNKFSGVDLSLVEERLNKSIKLSYTSMSTYYRCKFAFYLERVLKIRVASQTFYTSIGTIYHEILEHLSDDGYDVDEALLAGEAEFSSKEELFYYHKLTVEFKQTLQILKEQLNLTRLTKEYHEQDVVVRYPGDFDRSFVGLIDKVIYNNINGVDYLAVIDYKTGSIHASLDNIEYGFNLQLPIYAYLLKKANIFKDPIVLGIYLQTIINKRPKFDMKLSVKDQLIKDTKLKGFSLASTDLEYLDSSYENSMLIDKLGVAKGSGTFKKTSKLIDQEQLDEVAEVIDSLIISAFDEIEKLDFEINPKIINDENKSCSFCPYENICYKNIKDYVYLETVKFGKEGTDGLD